MSDAPKVIWSWPDGSNGWYSAGASTEVNLGLGDERAKAQSKYHHETTVTALEERVERLEKALEEIRRMSQKGSKSTGLRMQNMDIIARNALKETGQ